MPSALRSDGVERPKPARKTWRENLQEVRESWRVSLFLFCALLPPAVLIALRTPFLTVLAAGALEGVLLGSVLPSRTISRFWCAVALAALGVWIVIVFEGTLVMVQAIDALKTSPQ